MILDWVERIHAIGVDLGGSRLRIAVVDTRGRLLRRVDLPAVPPARLGDRLRELWRQWKIAEVEFLTVGSKGVWEDGERRNLVGRLVGLARQTTVLSDVELALAAMDGTSPRGARILLVAGTGSMALGRRGRRLFRAGGLGPKKGDEGSGFWMVCRWESVTSGRPFARVRRERSADPAAVRRTAARAVRLLRNYKGDDVARDIVEDAWIALANQVMAVRRSMGVARADLALAGGLFADGDFRRGFQRFLTQATPGVFRVLRRPSTLDVFAARCPSRLVDAAALSRPSRGGDRGATPGNRQ